MLPSNEKKRLRKKMRSPEAYEKSRESVRGPEELAEEMDQNELMAELKFALETEPHVQEALKQVIEKDLTEVGLENITEISPSSNMIDALSSGSFELSIEPDESTGHEHMVISTEGNVSEKVPLTKKYTDKFIAT